MMKHDVETCTTKVPSEQNEYSTGFRLSHDGGPEDKITRNLMK